MALTKVTYAMIDGAMANVMDYIPNNVDPSTTDVTQYFNAAFVACNVIYVPNGTYILSELKLESGYEIHGESKTGVIFKGLSSTTKIIKSNNSVTDYNNLPPNVINLTLNNFTLDMSDMPDLNTNNGIYLTRSFNNVIKNISYISDSVFPVNANPLNIDGFTYTTAIYDCYFPFVRCVGKVPIGAVNGFTTTISFYNLSAWGVEMAYVNSTTFYNPILQKEYDKFSFGPGVSNITIIGGDIEQANEKYYLNGNGNFVGYITSINNALGGLQGGYKDSASTWASCSFFDEYTQYGPRYFSALTRSGTVATGTTTENHMLNTGDACEIFGASDANFNGIKTVTVTGAKTFTYIVANTGATDGYAAGSYVAPNWSGNGGAWYPIGTTSFWRNVAGSRWNTDTVKYSGQLLGAAEAISDCRGTVLANGSGKIGWEHQTPSDNYYPEIFRNAAGTSVGNIASTVSATAYNTSSDYRLKENIQPMQNALATVVQLNPVTYTWKVDGSDGQGFIAHELQAIVPDAVTGEKDAVDEKGNPIYQGVDTSFLVATLTKAIQELKAEVDSLKGAA